MKIDVIATTSRCEAGNMDTSITVQIDTEGRGYGNAPPTIGALNAAFDGARKSIVAAIEADRKGRA